MQAFGLPPKGLRTSQAMLASLGSGLSGSINERLRGDLTVQACGGTVALQIFMCTVWIFMCARTVALRIFMCAVHQGGNSLSGSFVFHFPPPSCTLFPFHSVFSDVGLLLCRLFCLQCSCPPSLTFSAQPHSLLPPTLTHSFSPPSLTLSARPPSLLLPALPHSFCPPALTLSARLPSLFLPALTPQDSQPSMQSLRNSSFIGQPAPNHQTSKSMRSFISTNKG